jgi:hypothetical protein
MSFRLPPILLVALLVSVPAASADGLARLAPAKLAAVQAAVAELAAERRPVEVKLEGYEDYRAILHCHSLLSHDSRSKLEEIIKAAKEVGVRVIMFTEHPAPHYDYVKDGHQGMHDGVLVVPGAETNGFLAYPRQSIQDQKTETPQQLADAIAATGGLSFLCHLEERMDWKIAGLTGMEMYNTHFDFMQEKRLVSALKNPLTLLALLPSLQKYPQEFFAALQDYPAEYLKRFDQLSSEGRLTGVAGNDSHHNVGMRAILQENGKVLIEDRLGQKLTELDPEKIALIQSFVKDKKPGDVVLELDLDPYERSLRHTSTHLLLTEQTVPAVWDALRQGRAYVAFDWIADPTGFLYFADTPTAAAPMGSEIPLTEELKLRVASPLPGIIKLLRDGAVVQETRARELSFEAQEPGVYRVEVWQNLDGDLRPWILTNPIYVRPAS